MASWFDGVTTFWEFAPDDTPLTPVASCTWVDISAYVRTDRGCRTQRGRASELSGFAPGTMTIHLDNRTRLFDSSNTAGTYYGKLLPMKQIRWRVVFGGTTAYLFTGYILGWPIAYPGMADSVVTIEAVDGFRILQQSEMPASAYSVEVLTDSPTYYWPMQDEDVSGAITALVGTVDQARYYYDTPAIVATRSDISVPIGESYAISGNGTTAARWFTEPSSVTVPASIELWSGPGTDASGPNITFAAAAQDFFYVTANATDVLLGYSHGGFRDSTGVGVYFTIPAALANLSYHVAATVSGTTMTLYVNGAVVGTDTLVAGAYDSPYFAFTPFKPIYIHMRGGITKEVSHVASYASVLSAARIKAHWMAGLYPYGHPYGERTGTRADRILDSISWPGGDTDLSTGETYCGDWLPESASALAGLRELESAEQGLLFVSGAGKVTFRDRQWQMTNTRAINAQVTFDDDGTDTPYKAVAVDGNQIDFIRNNITVTYPGGTVKVKDTTSITAYAIQSDSVSANALPAGASFLARQLANFRLRTRKDPATRVPTIAVSPRSNMAQCFAVATLEIGDRVVVNRRPSGGAGSIAAKCQVQGIDHTMTGDQWEIRLMLAPAPKSYTEAPYLIAGGSSAYSNVGVASGNLVPF